jgi:hypothetical protein
MIPVSILPVQDAILPRRIVQVQRGNVDVAGVEAWDSSALTCGRVTDAEARAKERNKKEAITGGMNPEAVVIEAENRSTALEDWQIAALCFICTV